MAGCECEIWDKVIHDMDTELKYFDPPDSVGHWTLGIYYIDHCPWCGAKLNPPEDD